MIGNSKKVKFIELLEMDEHEQIVCQIRKHPVGLVSIYVTGLFIAACVLIGGMVFGSWINNQSELQTSFSLGGIISLISIAVSLVVVFFTYVAGYIYQNNVIIVTTDKIAQILYKNLVDRKISQLSIGDLQDVTVEQVGLLARVFKYGTLIIETAGEQNNYNFTYAPYPYECAKDIVEAREGSIKKYGN